MKPQFQHKATTSFVMWLDNYLPSKQEAFSNKTGSFYYMEDDTMGSTYYSYSSPYKQWLTDSGVNGADIIESVSGSGGQIYNRNSGVVFDFDNGRVLLPRSSFSKSEQLSGTFAVKDFNIYLTNETEEHLIIESKYEANSRSESKNT